jgi:hypothetical protein
MQSPLRREAWVRGKSTREKLLISTHPGLSDAALGRLLPEGEGAYILKFPVFD